MLNIPKIGVWSFDLDHLDVSWEIQPVYATSSDLDTHEILNYEFYVLRAEDSPAGEYATIAGPLRDQYGIRDNTVSLVHKWRPYYYKIRVVHKPTGEEATFGPVNSTQAPPDLVAAEVIRSEDILFRGYIGRACWLFPVRTFGPYCSCFDPIMRKKVRGNHPPCYGTGFFMGYHSPIEVYVQIDPTPTSPQVTAQQIVVDMTTRARLGPYPEVKPGDILVEATNKRWRIVPPVTRTQRLRTDVHQEVTLHLIPPGDIEYGLPLNVTKQNVVDQRNYTMPSAVPEQDYSDIIAVYQRPGWRS